MSNMGQSERPVPNAVNALLYLRGLSPTHTRSLLIQELEALQAEINVWRASLPESRRPKPPYYLPERS